MRSLVLRSGIVFAVLRPLETRLARGARIHENAERRAALDRPAEVAVYDAQAAASAPALRGIARLLAAQEQLGRRRQIGIVPPAQAQLAIRVVGGHVQMRNARQRLESSHHLVDG